MNCSNKPDAANPAIASGLQLVQQWRGVVDPGRSGRRGAAERHDKLRVIWPGIF